MSVSSTHHPLDLATVAGVRLRTLVWVRWVAIAAQFATVMVVQFGLSVPLPVDALLTAILASAVLNLGLTLWRPVQRLNEQATAVLLAWDVVQLGALLFFTGGLANPFALLLLAPVTVSATVLPGLHTIALSLLTMVGATVLARWYVPLRWPQGDLDLPILHLVGVWTAIVIGTAFFAAYVGRVAAEARRATQALNAAQAALAREQRLAAVGALAAATAHELGTPLGTIHLVANEIADEITPDDPLAEDVALLKREAARCRDILQGLSAKADPEESHGPLSRLPPAALIETVSQRYRRAEIAVEIRTEGKDIPPLPRSPELLHGLANVLQNAIQFARRRVEATVRKVNEGLEVTILDDGPGFPAAVLDHLGEPYVSTRARDSNHMGLGVFIAINLLERSGASLDFSNRAEGGAMVKIRWPLSRLGAESGGRP